MIKPDEKKTRFLAVFLCFAAFCLPAFAGDPAAVEAVAHDAEIDFEQLTPMQHSQIVQGVDILLGSILPARSVGFLDPAEHPNALIGLLSPILSGRDRPKLAPSARVVFRAALNPTGAADYIQRFGKIRRDEQSPDYWKLVEEQRFFQAHRVSEALEDMRQYYARPNVQAELRRAAAENDLRISRSSVFDTAFREYNSFPDRQGVPSGAQTRPWMSEDDIQDAVYRLAGHVEEYWADPDAIYHIDQIARRLGQYFQAHSDEAVPPHLQDDLNFNLATLGRAYQSQAPTVPIPHGLRHLAAHYWRTKEQGTKDGWLVSFVRRIFLCDPAEEGLDTLQCLEDLRLLAQAAHQLYREGESILLRDIESFELRTYRIERQLQEYVERLRVLHPSFVREGITKVLDALKFGVFAPYQSPNLPQLIQFLNAARKQIPPLLFLRWHDFETELAHALQEGRLNLEEAKPIIENARKITRGAYSQPARLKELGKEIPR